MIETAVETAVDEPANLNRQGSSDKELCDMICKDIGPDDDAHDDCMLCGMPIGSVVTKG